ncbi:hypothetical protein [Cerasicoccus maritimus]|uniref:hypothetical protein n=1 Tax=Cerasicoccus maritimus TaxID=490089 RepID=UPI0028524A3D|nr:hypothetical protein [Cerasicoccus maritimus]
MNEFMDTLALHEYLKNTQSADEWWLAVDGKIMDSPMACSEVERICGELPRSRMHVIHVDHADREDSSWIQVQEKAKAKQSSEDDISGDASDERLAMLEAKVELLQHTLDAMIDMLRELDSFDQLRQMLDERANFIHQSEEALIHQTMEFEERSAELEQKREDLGLD